MQCIKCKAECPRAVYIAIYGAGNKAGTLMAVNRAHAAMVQVPFLKHLAGLGKLRLPSVKKSAEPPDCPSLTGVLKVGLKPRRMHWNIYLPCVSKRRHPANAHSAPL